MDENLKGSILDTLLLTIKDPHFREVTGGQLEACSHSNNHVMNAPGNDQLPGQVASGKESVMHVEGQ